LKVRFVSSPRGNYHMTELLAGLCAVARDAGLDAELVISTFPPLQADTVYVVIPHEYYACETATAWPSPDQRARTIALCTENPGASWFEDFCEVAPRFPQILAINRSSLAELHRRGLAADHLQLGYTHHWDGWEGEDRARPIDVTYLVSADPRRDALLAGYGRWLSRRRTVLLLAPPAPKPGARPDYLADSEKFSHLSRAKLLVNLHRSETHSFEWLRVLQAIANGCVVISEPSLDHAPLVPGEDFVVAAADSIPHVALGLLEDPDRLRAIRAHAYETVRRELEMGPAVARLAAAGERLLANGSARRLAADFPSAHETPLSEPQPATPDESARLRSAVGKLATETVELHRAVQRLLERSEGRDPDREAEPVAFTPSYREATPRVSVAITLHNYERDVLDALGSVAASEFEDYEVLVLDDASRDGSLEAVRDFLAEHPWMPAALLRHRVNRGLGASRNALARHARGELMFVLDADNAIYPTALGRLVEALDRDPGATFAYPMISVTHLDQPVGLTSRFAWDPNGFRTGNYIDAMALIRVDDLWVLGGYTEDSRLTSWEDFHLWCACAEAGMRGVLVPEVLARYRKSGHSMLAWTGTDLPMAWSLMHARFPRLVGPAFV
jgi:Glycosyl transferase family 2/Glycosyl transferases group 1